MWLKICGGALILAIAAVLLRQAKGEALPLQWTGIIVIGSAALLLWQPILEWLNELCAAQGLGTWCTLLLKGLGVALLTQFCADLCRQSGEGTLAGGVEMAGRAEILLLCLPLLRDLVTTATGLLGG